MRKLFERHLHKDRVHVTAALGVLIALSLLGWDLAIVNVAEAPTLIAAILHPLNPGIQIIDSTPPASKLYLYIEVVDSCGPYYSGTCVNMRSGPGEEYPVVAKLRTGIVLKVASTVVSNGRQWYQIEQDSDVRFRDRITSDWFVAADVVNLFSNDGDHLLPNKDDAASSKHIVVDLSEEMLYAYDNDVLFMQEPISRGLDLTPTPVGTFTVYKMTPSRYMQGPIEGVSDQYYDLPGVPWNLYFTNGGAVIHGAYWHDHFGQPWSHGCVNLPPQKAKELYVWAQVGTTVTVKN